MLCVNRDVVYVIGNVS